jgi:hypothetical protein
MNAIDAATRRKGSKVHGNSGEQKRGAWCTPKWIADAVGRYQLDPFSNARSHIDAECTCELERGDNGLARREGRKSDPGCYYTAAGGYGHADESTKVWGQPPYSIVLEAIKHYGHTSFTFLLRFDPSTEWFSQLYRRSALVLVPRRRRINFEPPPGVKASTSTFPHALFYARFEDATPAILRACIAWKTR